MLQIKKNLLKKIDISIFQYLILISGHSLILTSITVFGFILLKVISIVRLISLCVGIIYYFIGGFILQKKKCSHNFFLTKHFDFLKKSLKLCLIDFLIIQPFNLGLVFFLNVKAWETSRKKSTKPTEVDYIIIFFKFLFILWIGIAYVHFEIYHLYLKTPLNNNVYLNFCQLYYKWSISKCCSRYGKPPKMLQLKADGELFYWPLNEK